MNIQTTKSNILNTLKIVEKAVRNRATMPILGNVLIKAHDGMVTLVTTNLDIYLSAQCKAKTEQNGEITLPCKKLSQIIGSLPSENLEINLDKLTVTITSGESTFKISGISADEFPKIPEINAEPLNIKSEDLKQLLVSTKASASTDENRYVLNSVLIHEENNKLIGVATDGRRLALAEKDSIGEIGNTIIPAASIDGLINVLGCAEQSKLRTSNKALNLTTQDEEGCTTIIHSKVVEGNYPNYKQVIPKNYEDRLKVNKEEITHVIQRAALILSEKNNSIKLTFQKDGTIRIQANSAEYGVFDESFKTEGELLQEIQVSLNPEFILCGLASAPDKEINILCKDELSPVLIKCPGYLQVIMPLRLN